METDINRKDKLSFNRPQTIVLHVPVPNLVNIESSVRKNIQHKAYKTQLYG